MCPTSALHPRTDTPAKNHKAERPRLDEIRRSQPRPRGQPGMTSIFPPTATAPSVAASHSKNQMNCGRPVSPWSLSPSPDPVRRWRTRRTPDNKRNQASSFQQPQFTGIGDRLAA